MRLSLYRSNTNGSVAIMSPIIPTLMKTDILKASSRVARLNGIAANVTIRTSLNTVRSATNAAKKCRRVRAVKIVDTACELVGASKLSCGVAWPRTRRR